MGNFLISLKITGGNEGGYNKDPDDKGGETIFGISRNNWPNWPGWKVVDFTKKCYPKYSIHQLNQLLMADHELPALRDQFYKQNFWDVNSLDKINDQQICNTMYDFGVNSGTSHAANFLQQVVKTAIDGKIGSKTLAAVNSGNAEEIYTDYNDLRNRFYHLIAFGTQAKYLDTWLSRLVPYSVST